MDANVFMVEAGAADGSRSPAATTRNPVAITNTLTTTTARFRSFVDIPPALEFIKTILTRYCMAKRAKNVENYGTPKLPKIAIFDIKN